MQAPTTPQTTWSRPAERIMAAINRDPLTAPHALRNDALLAVVAAALAVGLGLLVEAGRRPDALGWTLLVACNAPIAWRRRRPLLVLLAVVVCVVPYHALDNTHYAPIPATYIALYTVAVTGRPLRTVLVGTGVIGLSISVMLTVSMHEALQVIRISGWVVAVLFCGVDVRVYRQYVASIVERAERAERTREEEARRRVAEEVVALVKLGQRGLDGAVAAVDHDRLRLHPGDRPHCQGDLADILHLVVEDVLVLGAEGPDARQERPVAGRPGIGEKRDRGHLCVLMSPVPGGWRGRSDS